MRTCDVTWMRTLQIIANYSLQVTKGISKYFGEYQLIYLPGVCIIMRWREGASGDHVSVQTVPPTTTTPPIS